MLLLLVDAKENVIKNLFMAANEISLNPSFALFDFFSLYIRFDKRERELSQLTAQFGRQCSYRIDAMVCDTSNVWLLSFAAEHANIVEFFEYFCRIEHNDNSRRNVKRFKSMCCVGTRTSRSNARPSHTNQSI